MKLADKEFKLNDIVEKEHLFNLEKSKERLLGELVNFETNNRNCYEIVSARIYDYNKTHIWLDCSQSGWDLEDTIKVQRDKIKYIVRTDNAMWR